MRSGVILLTLLSGCGYSTGLQLAPEYESLGVEVFANNTQVRDVERDLHISMTRFVRDRVSAALRAPGRADLVLRGEIINFRYRRGIRSSENQQLETGLSVVARASLWNPDEEELVAGPVVASTQVGYALDTPFGEQDARKRALENLAERLLLDLLTSMDHQAGPRAPSDHSRQ